MGFLSSLIKNAVDEGISKGIRDAVGKATESVIAPKAEAYANKVADTFDEATQSLEDTKEERKNNLSSLEQSLNRMSASAERYANAMEKSAGAQEDLIKEWSEKLPGFPVWCFGGTNFILDDISQDGNIYYAFNVDDVTQEDLDMYILLLKKDGFIQKYKDSNEILYKELDGKYLLVGTTDAFGTYPTMSLNFGIYNDRSEIDN